MKVYYVMVLLKAPYPDREVILKYLGREGFMPDNDRYKFGDVYITFKEVMSRRVASLTVFTNLHREGVGKVVEKIKKDFPVLSAIGREK